MKRLSFLAMTFLAVLTVQAQMIAYGVQTSLAGVATEPTVIDLQGTTGKDLSGQVIDAEGNMVFNESDAEGLTGFPIGFEFPYNSQKMTHFLVGTDLEVQLAPQEAITTTVFKHTGQWFTSSDVHDVVGLCPREGVFGLEYTQISYWNETAGGEAVALCVEWKNFDLQSAGWSIDNVGAKATVTLRFSKNGNIEIKLSGFKPENTATYDWIKLGILGDANDFLAVNSWEGSVTAATNYNGVSYSPTSYPADGTVYSFVAPEACETPTASGSDLVLTSTTDQISGEFTVGNGDHYLVLATTDAELSEKPADMTKYAAGQEVGNAKVIAIATEGKFESITGMEQGTYNVFVYAFNSLCMNGPLYAAEPVKAAIALKPGKPASLTVTATDKTALSLNATDNGAQMVIAMTTEQEVNSSNQYLENGVFGTPTGTLNVGDEIEGGGKVIYVGSTNEAISLGELTPGTAYFFRAWSTDGNGGYSSEWLDTNAMTAAELPWQYNWKNTTPGCAPIGWTQGEDDNWSGDGDDPYFYVQISGASEEEFVSAYRETSDICLGEGSNWISIDVAGNQRAGWMGVNPWTLADGEQVKLQVTKDGQQYEDVLVISKDNVEEMASEDFKTFRANFTTYAGEKVRVRLLVSRCSNGQVQFKNFKLEGTMYGIVGTIPGLTWDDDFFLTQSADNKNVYTGKLDVTIDAVPESAYEYKLRTNQNWEGYQIPADNTNQSWMPAEAGEYSLLFTADVENHTLSLSVQRPFEVTFKNEEGWQNVYAYTWIEDGNGNVIAKPSGTWPGTPVEATRVGWSRKWIYSFTADQAPQFIIFNNGEEGEDKAQTADLAFENHKEYSAYPEITSVKISGEWNGWDGPEMEALEGASNAYQTTVNLTGATEDQQFKLVVNGEWIGSGEATIEDEGGFVTEGENGANLTLKAGKSYDIVAFWQMPGVNVKEGWLINVVENTTTAVAGVRANAAQQTIHNLKGQRLQQARRGVNIVNGRKVAVK